MHLLRWNNISTRGAQHQTCVFYAEGGWKPRKCFPAPVEGEIFSLTFPFYRTALALRTRQCVKAILRQLRASGVPRPMNARAVWGNAAIRDGDIIGGSVCYLTVRFRASLAGG